VNTNRDILGRLQAFSVTVSRTVHAVSSTVLGAGICQSVRPK